MVDCTCWRPLPPKVFLVLYFWYVFLFASTVFFVTYRVATIFLPPFRERALLLRARCVSWTQN